MEWKKLLKRILLGIGLFYLIGALLIITIFGIIIYKIAHIY